MPIQGFPYRHSFSRKGIEVLINQRVVVVPLSNTHYSFILMATLMTCMSMCVWLCMYTRGEKEREPSPTVLNMAK